MPAAVVATVTPPEMIRCGKNHQTPVVTEISGPERKHGERNFRQLTPTRSRVGAVGARLRLASSVTQRTMFGRNLHGNLAWTR